MDLLTELGLWETIDTEQERILYNFAVNLLVRMEILDPLHPQPVIRLLAGLAPYPREDIPESGVRDVLRS